MLQVHEIFYSLQGESSYAGQPCVFIRLTGCNLRCSFCDTRDAFAGGTPMNLNHIVEQVGQYGVSLVELTGGEPLLQPETAELISVLTRLKYTVLVETNGSLPIDVIAPPAIRIVDIKCPGSNQTAHMDWDNIAKLRKGDEIKFVISDGNDFDFTLSTLRQYPDLMQYPIHLSPNLSTLSIDELAKWILNAKLPVRLQIQLHKILKMK